MSKTHNRRRGRRRYRTGVRERQIQLIKRGVTSVLVLCVILLGVLIVQDLRGGKTAKEVGAKGNQKTTENSKAAKAQSEALTPEDVADVAITVSAAGDCTLGTDEEFDAETSFDAMYNSVDDPAYFFRNVKPIFEQDDLTIVNLEGPLTTSDDIQEKQFAFRGKPSYVEILTQGSVEAVNLANNHSKDYGEQGYQDTIQNAQNAGITSFGYDQTAIMEIKGVKVGLVGIYVLADGLGRMEQLKAEIAAVKQQGAQLIIANFHWGNEKENYPDDTQKTLAHAAIDEGADLVLGHHPHVLQGIEKYKGKYIAYSLANFCFGGNSNPSDKDTMIFQQTFTIQKDGVLADNQIQVIPCSVSSESDYNNYQPTPAEGEEKIRIQARIDELSSGF